jgi:hypothetical protein
MAPSPRSTSGCHLHAEAVRVVEVHRHTVSVAAGAVSPTRKMRSLRRAPPSPATLTATPKPGTETLKA